MPGTWLSRDQVCKQVLMLTPGKVFPLSLSSPSNTLDNALDSPRKIDKAYLLGETAVL